MDKLKPWHSFKALWIILFLFPAIMWGQLSVTGPGSVCIGDSITLTGNAVTWTWTSSDTSIAVVYQNGIVEGNSPGTVTITYSDGVQTPYQHQVIVGEVPPSLGISKNEAHCQENNGTAIIPLSVKPLGANYKIMWYEQDNNGQLISIFPHPTTSSNGISLYSLPLSSPMKDTLWVTQKNINGGCENDTLMPIFIDVVGNPSAPVTQDLNYCFNQQGVPALTASLSPGNTLFWSSVSNQGPWVASIIPSTTNSATYWVRQGAPVGLPYQGAQDYCYSPVSELDVTIHSNPNPPTVPNTNLSYCEGEIALPLSAQAVYGHHLNWYDSNQNLIATGNDPPPIPQTNVGGITKVYYVSQQNSLAQLCESSKVRIDVKIKDKLPKPVSSEPLPLEYCVNDPTAGPIAISSIPPTYQGILEWFDANNNPINITFQNPYPDVNTAGTTLYKVRWNSADSSNYCPSETLEVIVIVHPNPTITANSPTICQNQSTILNASGAGANGSYQWNGGVQNATWIVSPLQTTTYTVTGTDENGCQGIANATVTVNSLPNPPTTSYSNPIVCKNPGQTYTPVINPTSNILKWYQNGNLVNPSPPAVPLNNTGNFTYTVTQTDGNSCESDELTITVSVVDLPPPPTFSQQTTYCRFDNIPTLSATKANTNYTLKWFDSNDNLLPSAPTPNNSIVGTQTFKVSQITPNSCESNKTTITITVADLPTKPTATQYYYDYCVGHNATQLSANKTLSSNILRWYKNDSTNTNYIGTSAPTPSTAAPGNSSVKYYVSQKNIQGCESFKAEIIVDLKPQVSLPVLSSGNVTEYCKDQQSSMLLASSSITGSLLWFLPDGSLYTSPLGFGPTPPTSIPGVFNYSVKERDGNGCESLPVNIPVTINNLPNISATDVTSCAGDSVILTATGAGPTGTYQWNGGVMNGEKFLPNSSGSNISYIVLGTDGNGCQNSDTAQVVVNALPIPPTANPTYYPYCNGASAQPFQITTTTGHFYNVYYSNSLVSTLSQNYSPSTTYSGTFYYSVTQESSLTGCESLPTTIQVEIGVGIPKPITFDVNACKNDPSGNLGSSAIAGSSYSLKWYLPNMTLIPVAPPFYTTTVGTTNYFVSQYDSQSQCESPVDTIQVTVNALPPVSAGVDQSICDGESVVLLGSGASTYSWSGADVTGNTITNGVAFTPPGNTSTTYTVTGTDANGCSNTDAVIVNTNAIPAPPTIDPNSQTTFITGSVSSVLSAISLPGFTLTWYNSDGTLVNGTGSAPTPSTAPTNVGITEYLVTQTSTSGCESAPLTVQIVVLGVNVSNDTTICLTDTAQLLVSTYSANTSTFNSTGYTFIGTYNGSDYYISPIDTSWSEVRNRALSDGGDLVNITDSAENYFVTQGLMPYSSTSFGSYYYMGIYQDLGSTSYAEPSGGWFNIDSNLVSYTNWKPGEPNNLLGTEHYSEIVIDSATQVEFWNDVTDNQAKKYGVIEVPASTSPSWSYLWSTGDTTSTINVNPTVDTQYWIAISDGSNTWYDTVDVTVNLLDITITQTDTILCAGDSSGTLGVAINPGYGPYSYLWSTGDISDSLWNVSVGTYSVMVTDTMGCTSDDAITIVSPNAVTLTTQSITNYNGYDISCNGGNDASAFVIAAGGTPGYSYSWSGGGTTDTLTSMAAGNYFVTVIDSNGCSALDTISITEPSALSLSVSTLTNVFGNQIDCYGDSSGVLFSAVAGGVGAYTYSWNTGASQDSIYNLGAGTYWVTAQDANGCSITDTITLTQPALPFTTVTSNLSNYNGFGISCNGATDGSISVLAQGSNAPYSYAWSNGATTVSQSNLGQGTYSVVVTDSLGCVSNASVIITEPSVLTYSYVISDVTCYLGQNGSVEIIPQGGVMPYNIQWFDGTDSTILYNLGSGYYAFVITDENNCLVLDSVEIYEPAEIEITVDTIQPTCERINDGQIDAFIYGGTYPYSYTLNGLPVNLPLDSVAVGSYVLTVVDSNSCTQTIAFNLEPLQPSCFMIPNMYSPNYDGYNDEFRIRHSSWSSYTLTIYNSIGQLVYSGSSITPYWDGITNGNPMPTGDYYYQLITNEGEVIYGYVTLIR